MPLLRLSQLFRALEKKAEWNWFCRTVRQKFAKVQWEVADDFINKWLNVRRWMIYLTFHVDYPQYELQIDFEKAKLAGVVSMRFLLLYEYIGQFTDFGLFFVRKIWKKFSGITRMYRKPPESSWALNFIHVISNKEVHSDCQFCILTNARERLVSPALICSIV